MASGGCQTRKGVRNMMLQPPHHMQRGQASPCGSTACFADLESAGVRRISPGSALYRSAMIAFMSATREVNENGTFGFVDRF